MPIFELRDLGTSAGVTIPRDDLVLEGLADEDEIDTDQQVLVEKDGPGTWSVQLLDNNTSPQLAD